MKIFDVLQLIGGMVLAVGYVPQIVKIIRTKSCRDLSIKTYTAMVIGIGLMELYALNLVLHGSGVMFLVTNSISLVFAAILCGLILFVRKFHDKKMPKMSESNRI